MSSSDQTPVTRGLLLRWIGWFGLVSALLFMLAGIRYLLLFGMPSGATALAYVGLAYPGQFLLLGFLPMTLLLIPLALLVPRKGLVLSLGAIIAALGLSLIILDTNVFAQNRFHLSALSIAIFDTSTWVLTGVVFVALLGFMAMLGGVVWQWVATRRNLGGLWLALVLVLVWSGGQALHIWADATAYTPVTSFTRYMPLYFPIKSKRRLAKWGLIDPVAVEQQRLLRQANAPDNGQLAYPLQPLSCSPAQPLPNILFILVDALRPDKIDAGVTPTIAAFAKQSQRFNDHYSGGNSSRMGFFSLFYGLPSTYWQSFYDLQRQPVLMEQLLANDYEIAAFSSVGFGSPAQIDRTVFAGVDSTLTKIPPGKGAYTDANAGITAMWVDWIAQRGPAETPYFGFLYYDPGNFVASEQAGGKGGSVEEREAEYMEGISSVDHMLGAVLDVARPAGDARETLIIIASDHGYEFDELGLGYVGHASNFGPWQLRSTLLLNWPGREPRVFSHRSAHQDFPGTLLQEVFGCTNPVSDYSSGGNLFDEKSWEWITAGSYTSHAIIDPDKLVVTYPGGLIELLGSDYRPDSKLKLDAQRMQEAMLEMRRFYK